MSGIVSSSFRLNLTVLKFIGLYPSRRHPILHKFYAVSLFALSLTLPFVFGILHFVFAEDLAAVDYNDYILVGLISYTFKYFPFLQYSEEIKNCVEYFDDCVVINSDQRLIIEECVSTCRRNSSVFISGCIVAFTVFIGRLFVKGDMEKLPLNVWLPQIWEETLLIYRCVYFLLIIGVTYATAANGSIEPLIAGLSHHASAQLQILGRCLQFLDENVNIPDEDNIYRKIRMCIQQYQHIVTFVDKYEVCFSLVVFSQFMGSVIVIAMCCVQLVVDKLDINLLNTMLTLSILFFQVLFYCYYGTLLTKENDSLFRAVYMSKWYDYDEQSKKALLVLMERSQRPLIVTAGKILTLSLETFTTILKRSYSFAAVLRNY